MRCALSFKRLTRVRASISLSTSCAQVSKASFHRATSQTLSLNLREVSLSSQAVYREESEKTTEGMLVNLYIYEEVFEKCRCPPKHEHTLQLVSLRRDLPSWRITLEMYRSVCAVADSWRLLLSHSDTLWRRPGFAESADVMLLQQNTNIPIIIFPKYN